MRDWTSKNIAEMVGIVAIVLSLLFVGYQLKQDRDIAISSAYQSRAFEAAEQARRLGENEAAVRGTIRASLMQDPDDPFPPGMLPSVFDGIPAKEVYASMTLVFAAMYIYENTYYQYTNGFLPEAHWQRIRLQIKESIRNDPLYRLSLDLYSPPQDFQVVIDSILAELETESAAP